MRNSVIFCALLVSTMALSPHAYSAGVSIYFEPDANFNILPEVHATARLHDGKVEIVPRDDNGRSVISLTDEHFDGPYADLRITLEWINSEKSIPYFDKETDSLKFSFEMFVRKWRVDGEQGSEFTVKTTIPQNISRDYRDSIDSLRREEDMWEKFMVGSQLMEIYIGRYGHESFARFTSRTVVDAIHALAKDDGSPYLLRAPTELGDDLRKAYFERFPDKFSLHHRAFLGARYAIWRDATLLRESRLLKNCQLARKIYQWFFSFDLSAEDRNFIEQEYFPEGRDNFLAARKLDVDRCTEVAADQ